MHLRCLAVLLLLLPLSSCNNGGSANSSAVSARNIEKAYTTRQTNPFQGKKKSWLQDKTDRLGLTKDKQVPRTIEMPDAFRSNQ